MRRYVIALLIFVFAPVLAQIEFVNDGVARWKCVEVIGGRDVFISGHIDEAKALQCIFNRQVQFPDRDFRAVATQRKRAVIDFEALAQSYPGANDSFPVGQPDPPNDPPEWLGTPNPQFQDNVASSYGISNPGPLVDADGDTLTLTLKGGSCTLPTGVTIDDANDELDYDGLGSAGTTANCIITANDGTVSVDSPAFSIVISETSAGLCWAAQGTPSYTPYPADRNGSTCTDVSPAIGAGQVWGGYSQWPTVDPTIIHVTTRADSGAGSLRAAMESTGCRVVVFDVGGEIALSSQISVDDTCLTVNGHATGASTMPWVTLAPENMTNGIFNIKVDQVILEGFALQVTSPLTCGDVRAVNINNDADHVMFLNMAFLGATDQNNSQGRGDNWQYIDSLFGNPQGWTLCAHNFNFLAQNSSQNGLLLGMVFVNGRNRNPLVRVENGTFFNTWIYNGERQAAIFGVDRNASTQPTFIWNISDIYYDAGPNEVGTPSAILITQAGVIGMANASEFYINRIRLDTGMCADAWDAGCVAVETNNEGNLRHNLTDNFYTGSVPTDISGLSEADVLDLHTQNNGPHPNNRPTDLEALYTNAKNGTLELANEYTFTPPADSAGAYTEHVDPHGDADMDGIPNQMEQFETERQAMYAN